MPAKDPAKFLRTCRYINAALDAWYIEITNRLGPLYRLIGDKTPKDPYSVPDFDVRSFSDGQKLFAYWTAKMLVFDIATRALGLFKPDSAEKSPWLDEDFVKRSLEIADSICILALYFFRTFDRVIGMQFPMMPLKSAATCYDFHGKPERQAWCFGQIKTAMDGNYGIWLK